MQLVRVGVIDIGANTLRLLVAESDGSRVVPVHTERIRLGLGEHVESEGRIPASAIAATVKAARREVERARRLGCSIVRTVITSPGRQASNGLELAAALAAVPGANARVLDAEEEASLGYAGALSVEKVAAESVAVCDVGGGSVQLVIGTSESGPVWWRSLDIGSLRLAHRHFAGADADVDAEALAAMRAEAGSAFSGIAPPLPQAALATGGTARALRKLVGKRLGPAELESALRMFGERSPKRLQREYGFTAARVRTLPAGAVLLAEAQRRLGVPFTVARGGVRDGVALAALAEVAAA
jgi:exopolyphosphatase / guanosine-5'-triphosphate,3'-diphosphate pyrophosphatase